MTSHHWRSPSEIACPRCKARPSDPCVDANGAPVQSMHVERLAAVRDERRTAVKLDPNGQLPRGRHGIPREDVRDHQRARALRAVERQAFHSTGPMTVSTVIDEAGISRRTFYELWPDLDTAVSEMARVVATRLRTFEGRAAHEHLLCAALAAGEIYAERNGGEAVPVLRGKLTEAAQCLSIALEREGWELRPRQFGRRAA